MNDKNTKISSLFPEDVRSLGRVYGFSVEGYVNFEAQRVRETTLETTPLMKAIEEKATQVASCDEISTDKGQTS